MSSSLSSSSSSDLLLLLQRPDVLQLGRILNEQVGPCVRIITYSYVLNPKNKNIFLGMCTDGTFYFFITNKNDSRF